MYQHTSTSWEKRGSPLNTTPGIQTGPCTTPGPNPGTLVLVLCQVEGRSTSELIVSGKSKPPANHTARARASSSHARSARARAHRETGDSQHSRGGYKVFSRGRPRARGTIRVRGRPALAVANGETAVSEPALAHRRGSVVGARRRGSRASARSRIFRVLKESRCRTRSVTSRRMRCPTASAPRR